MKYISQALTATLLTVCLATSFAPKVLANAPTTAAPTLEQPVTIPDQLKLTPQQKQKIQAINTEHGKQILTVLTPAQKTKFLKGMKTSKSKVAVLKTLNDLTPDQKKKLSVILKANSTKVKAELTAEQLKQLEKLTSKSK
jgi:Spy/CpxP family protein refolding chaperone